MVPGRYFRDDYSQGKMSVLMSPGTPQPPVRGFPYKNSSRRKVVSESSPEPGSRVIYRS